MTEAKWLACIDPGQMLQFLRGKTSERKLRLFSVACCRHIWRLMPDERSRRAVEIGEALADGLVTDTEAEIAGNAAAEVIGNELPDLAEDLGWRAARAADHLLPLPEESWQLHLVWEYAATVLEGEQLIKEGASPEMLDAWSEVIFESGRPMGCTSIDPGGIIADRLREIIGPIPFGRGGIAPDILHWSDRTIPKVAQAIYDERAFDRMPILADALEDAGCDNADILNHCRQSGEHVRGCWVVDLLLGKE